MEDAHVIAHQARKIAELEVGLHQHREGERQLLAMLRSAGIVVKQMELSPQEAEFLDNYRRATAEGKSQIRTEIEKQVVAARERKEAAEQKLASRHKKHKLVLRPQFQNQPRLLCRLLFLSALREWFDIVSASWTGWVIRPQHIDQKIHRLW
jgi:hypothetical protein